MTKLHVKVGSVWKPLDASNADTLNGLSLNTVLSKGGGGYSSEANTINSHAIMGSPNILIDAGETISGSHLRFANMYEDQDGLFCTKPAGTWRCLGYSGMTYYNSNKSLFIRIS